MNILILGASYGSLLSTKLLMAGHDVTLVCQSAEADLINQSGTEVRIKIRGEESHRSIYSTNLPGTLKAATPIKTIVSNYDLVALAMQEPQYSHPEVRALLNNIAQANLPCLSIMNMPPLAYLKRIPALQGFNLSSCYKDSSVWDMFKPQNVSLCSPDPQAFRPPEEGLNVLHVGLPTNFKAAQFESAQHNAILRQLASDIESVKLEGKDVPVKLRIHESLFVPMAKWAMLLTGNYRCIGNDGITSIQDAVHHNVDVSAGVYKYVEDLVQRIGGNPADAVPFEKYANAAKSLMKPSSAARAIDAGAVNIERVDKLVQLVGKKFNMQNDIVDQVVGTVDKRLQHNARAVEVEA